MDLADRTIHTPALAQVSPLQNKLPDRIRNTVFDICHFCHDRYYRSIERICQGWIADQGRIILRSPACIIGHLLEVFMATYLRAASAIATLLCVACATTTADV